MNILQTCESSAVGQNASVGIAFVVVFALFLASDIVFTAVSLSRIGKKKE